MGGWANPGSPLPGDDESAERGPLPHSVSGGRGAVPGDDDNASRTSLPGPASVERAVREDDFGDGHGPLPKSLLWLARWRSWGRHWR